MSPVSVAGGRRLGWEARRIPCASLLLAGATVTVFAFPGLAGLLQYDRAAIAAGEIWRLITAHFVHYSLDHLFWDLLAFSCLGLVCEHNGSVRFLLCVFGSALAISAAVWLWLPGLGAYRGLSGVDSALFGLLFADVCHGAVRSRRLEQGAVAAVCFVAFFLKISFELITQTNVFAQNLGPAAVGVPLAHIVGASIGLLVGFAVSGEMRA